MGVSGSTASSPGVPPGAVCTPAVRGGMPGTQGTGRRTGSTGVGGSMEPGSSHQARRCMAWAPTIRKPALNGSAGLPSSRPRAQPASSQGWCQPTRKPGHPATCRSLNPRPSTLAMPSACSRGPGLRPAAHLAQAGSGDREGVELGKQLCDRAPQLPLHDGHCLLAAEGGDTVLAQRARGAGGERGGRGQASRRRRGRGGSGMKKQEGEGLVKPVSRNR